MTSLIQNKNTKLGHHFSRPGKIIKPTREEDPLIRDKKKKNNNNNLILKKMKFERCKFETQKCYPRTPRYYVHVDGVWWISRRTVTSIVHLHRKTYRVKRCTTNTEQNVGNID